jgi:predicted nucleic acid-binding Zn ribbon protein
MSAMRNEPTAQDVINKYQKRQNRAPMMFVLGAILLIAIIT